MLRLLIQCGNDFRLCDAWQGIHFLTCRGTQYKGFKKWIKRLVKILNTFMESGKLIDMMNLFGKNPFINTKVLSDDFKEDQTFMDKQDEYTQKWEAEEYENITEPAIRFKVDILELKRTE